MNVCWKLSRTEDREVQSATVGRARCKWENIQTCSNCHLWNLTRILWPVFNAAYTRKQSKVTFSKFSTKNQHILFGEKPASECADQSCEAVCTFHSGAESQQINSGLGTGSWVVWDISLALRVIMAENVGCWIWKCNDRTGGNSNDLSWPLWGESEINFLDLEDVQGRAEQSMCNRTPTKNERPQPVAIAWGGRVWQSFVLWFSWSIECWSGLLNLKCMNGSFGKLYLETKSPFCLNLDLYSSRSMGTGAADLGRIML